MTTYPHPVDRLTDEACRLIAKRAYTTMYGWNSWAMVAGEPPGSGLVILDRDTPWEFDLHEELAVSFENYGIVPARGSDDPDWDEALAPRVSIE